MSETIKILFVCSHNKWRSLTAEKMYEGFVEYQVRSAGTDPGARVRVTSGHIGWADWIFVMERKHFMDPDLVDVLKARLSEYIDVPE